MNRYIRQMMLPEIGETGQQKLRDTKIVVIGAGGLGCPVLSYLAGAGIGNIVIVDPDTIEKSNLHRQPLYTMESIGKSKAQSAVSALLTYNPDIYLCAHVIRLEPANVAELTQGADIIIDAADSFAVTYTLSDHCHKSGQVLISASVLGFSGYAGGFCGNKAPSVRAIFPDLPISGQTCSTAGVSGPAVGMLGALQAQLALNCILDIEPSPLGRMINLDLRQLTTSVFSFVNALEPKYGFGFISVKDIDLRDTVVDLRSVEEALLPITDTAIRCSVSEIAQVDISHNSRTVICCKTGLRAWNAALKLQKKGCEDIALIALC